MDTLTRHGSGRRLAFFTAGLAGFALLVPIIQWSSTGHAFRGAPEPGIMEGSIATLDLVSHSPRMGVQVGEGQVVDLGLDPKDTVILYGGQPATVDQLAVGRHVKTYYRQRNGQPVATSIVVQPPVLSFPPPAASVDATGPETKP